LFLRNDRSTVVVKKIMGGCCWLVIPHTLPWIVRLQMCMHGPEKKVIARYARHRKRTRKRSRPLIREILRGTRTRKRSKKSVPFLLRNTLIPIIQ
jgi:hypothetical protein